MRKSGGCMKDFLEKSIRILRDASQNAAMKVEKIKAFEHIATRESLVELVDKKLKNRKLIIVSNREPYAHVYQGDSIIWYKSAGGLTVALDSMASACGATWICHGDANADFRVTDKKGLVSVPPDNPKYILKRIKLSRKEVAEYYEGFSNEMLWPLCHVCYVRPKFIHAHWLTYQSVNKKFAQAVIEEADQGSIIFIQDYHLCLAAKYIKEKRPDLTTVMFWHIPWPNSEVFRICPWKEEILEGLIANDILGFHLKYHADNFAETVDHELECRIDREKMRITRNNMTSKISAYPISIDFQSIYHSADSIATHKTIDEKIKEYRLHNVKIGLGVDRLDYTKGVPERLDAIDLLLSKYPEHIGTFTFIQIGVPSRTHIEDYQNVVNNAENRCLEINAKYETEDWEPVKFLKGQHSFDVLIPFYKMADVCIVSSLHDGMNLVAKEFIAASSNDKGVLILSQFTGAARELEQAILVNPYDTESFAEALHQSLIMKTEDQRIRLARMRLTVAENNIFTWAQSILSDVVRLAEDSQMMNIRTEGNGTVSG
jgi:alpha,alpha-trehalose-phosphate synthase [UDP-forming]